MHFKRWSKVLTVTLILLSNTLYAATNPPEQVQVSVCLEAKMIMPHQVLAENSSFKIVELPSSEVQNLSILADSAHCGRFVNVSSQFVGRSLLVKQHYAQSLLKNPLSVKRQAVPYEIKYEIKHSREVNTALKNIVADNIWQTVTHMSSYYNRSATKKLGVLSANWLKNQFNALAVEYGRLDTDAFFVATGSYKQPSLVTVIGRNIDAPALVIGAHMDTLDGRMPGAGDDASGSATIMEAARVLLSSKAELKRPIYIIWYAAEERGLVGSQYVVQHFKNKAIPVKAAIQFDMTGYRSDPQDPTLWVYTDYTDTTLNHFVSDLIKTYVHVPVGYSECGYGCSDHASWTEQGIPAAFPCETDFEKHNPYIHTESDTMNLLNLEHMTNFTKLALAFALELGLE